MVESSLPVELQVRSSTSEEVTEAARPLGSTRPNLFLPQEKWAPPVCRALQGQEAPQVLEEREVPLASLEPPEMQGKQVSDGRSWGRPSVLLCPPDTADAHPSTLTPSGQSCNTGQWGESVSRRVHRWA